MSTTASGPALELERRLLLIIRYHLEQDRLTSLFHVGDRGFHSLDEALIYVDGLECNPMTAAKRRALRDADVRRTDLSFPA